MAVVEVNRFLEVERGVYGSEVLYRVQQGWIVDFRIGASLFGTGFDILTNHPLNEGQGYRRAEFHVIPWKKAAAASDPTAFSAPLKIRLSGGFEYRYEDSETHEVLGDGFFVVEPQLSFADGKALPLDGVVMQTVITKLLGPLKEWESRLLVAGETGYNMIHFTPIQELGDSKSAYALNDQLKVAPTIGSSMDDVGKQVQSLYSKNNLLSIVDIVLNHTASSSPWLKDHPEVTYNLENIPHLRPAFLLDCLLIQFSKEIEDGKWTDRGIPPNITEGYQLDRIKHALWHEIFPRGKLHEYYLADTGKVVDEFRTAAQQYKPYTDAISGQHELHITPGPAYERFGATVDLDAARAIFHAPTSIDGNDPKNDWRINESVDKFKGWLDAENGKNYGVIQNHLSASLSCISGSIYYERLQHDGPHYGPITKKKPLVAKYFQCPEEFSNFTEAEAASLDAKRKRLVMAHNGWVMSFDPLKNFAAEECNIYLRRELIPWTDNVKLRYGEKPEDCPYLWSRMKDYVVQMCAMFHGVRLDNAHSTPLAVAEYMLDAGRTVNSNLYVTAELFTGSEGRDNVFVNRLGLTSLIREAGNARDSHDLGRHVHRYGGDPVGAFNTPSVSKLRPSMTHALFFDQTHDNPSMIKKRSLSDVLPSAATVSVAYSAAGSARGYDELLPFAVDIVTETRLYRSYGKAGPHEVDQATGILKVRSILNKLHFTLAKEGYSQIFVDQMDNDTMAITRHNPLDHSSYVAVIRSAFKPTRLESFLNPPPLRALQVEGNLENVVLEACVDILSDDVVFKDSPDAITGLADGFKVYFHENLDISKSRFIAPDVNVNSTTGKREIHFAHFPPGAVIIFKFTVGSSSSALADINKRYTKEALSTVKNLCKNLAVAEFNRILFRTGQEEADDGKGVGVYVVPQMGTLPYCGLQSFMSILDNLRHNNDLGHPFCENLRSGDWMMEYISGRLRNFDSTVPLADWLDTAFAKIRLLPRYLLPRYFDAVLSTAYRGVVQAAWETQGPFVHDGSDFSKMLALGTYQMCGIVMSSKLPALSPSLALPQPPKVKNPGSGELVDGTSSFAAGLPHFSTGWARNWGRDTFISMHGLLLLTERFQEARYIILAYAACLRHGLIPNLLSEGTGARYNARDAVWWWLYSIQQFVKLAPKGEEVLNDVVSRLYVNDDSPPGKPGEHDQPLREVMQEALTKHIQGTNFRERNAGWNLDREMCSEGFNNGIGVDLASGFVYGGNPHNCGTWMDKMGSSEKAGTKGKPASPRDGSAIELVALCYSTVTWLSDLKKAGRYPYNGVKWSVNAASGTQEKNLSFSDWSQLIKTNFEPRFYVAEDSSGDFIRRDLVHVTPMYKDTYGSFHFWADYQLRPNQCIALVVAPDLFDPKHAWGVLDTIQERLLGPLGMKTLDAKDWAYGGNYDNSDDGSDPKYAHGFNYHQGPEWVWLMGYFLRAKLIFAQLQGDTASLPKTRSFVESVLSKHWDHIRKSDWRGLPELTNADGAFCSGSCPTQAWSMASILAALHCLQQTSA